jgi:hypothetical protein
MSITKPSKTLKFEKKEESYSEMFKALLAEAKIAKSSLFDPTEHGAAIKNFEELENEFNLIQEKKSELSARKRDIVVQTYLWTMANAQKQEESNEN